MTDRPTTTLDTDDSCRIKKNKQKKPVKPKCQSYFLVESYLVWILAEIFQIFQKPSTSCWKHAYHDNGRKKETATNFINNIRT